MIGLDTLRDEHAEQGIGPQIADLLAQIARATAPTYPAADYSPSGVWDEASLKDATQDWIVTRLIERGDLAVLLASARNVGGLRALLTRSFGQHLTNRRRRTSATNLFARTAKLLRTDDTFALAAPSAVTGEQGWTVREHQRSTPASPDLVTALVKAAGMRTDTELGVVRYGPYSLKSSPVLREPELREFVGFLLTQADGCLTLIQIFDIMRHRFNLIEPMSVTLDEVVIPGTAQVAATVETGILARSVAARLGADRTRLLRALADADGDPEAASARAGATPAHLTEAVEAAYALIAEYADDADEAVAVYRRLVESLYMESEGQ